MQGTVDVEAVPDPKRKQCLGEADIFKRIQDTEWFKHLDEQLAFQLSLIHDNIEVVYWSALLSDTGGTEQAMHQEFTEHGTWPRFAGIFSLDGKGKILMERLDLKGGKVELSLGAGDAVIFRGDKMHAGATYNEEHRRLYFKACAAVG